jgi:hypothetical protein
MDGVGLDVGNAERAIATRDDSDMSADISGTPSVARRMPLTDPDPVADAEP